MSRFIAARWSNKRMDLDPFQSPSSQCCSQFQSNLCCCYMMIYILNCYNMQSIWYNVIYSGYTLVICRSVAPVWSPQTRSCQLYQMIVCCHGDRNGVGSGFLFWRDKQTDSFQVCARAEKHLFGKTNWQAKQYNGYRDDKPLPLSFFLLIPGCSFSSHWTA